MLSPFLILYPDLVQAINNDSKPADTLIFTIWLGLTILIFYAINHKRGIQIQVNIKQGFPKLVEFTKALFVVWIIQMALFIPVRFFLFSNNQTETNIDIYFLLAALLLAPLLEEFIFRKILLDLLLDRYKKTKAIVIATLIFAVIHVKPQPMLLALVIGWYFSILYIRHKNLAFTILLHAFTNALGITSMLLVNHFSAHSWFTTTLFLHTGFCLLVLVYTQKDRLIAWRGKLLTGKKDKQIRKLVEVFRGSYPRAMLVKGLLTEAGIPVLTQNELMSGLHPWAVSAGGVSPVVIWVRAEQAAAAGAIIGEYLGYPDIC